MNRLGDFDLCLHRDGPVSSLSGNRDVLSRPFDRPAEDPLSFNREALRIAEGINRFELLLENRKLLRIGLVESFLDGLIQVHQDLLKRLGMYLLRQGVLAFTAREDSGQATIAETRFSPVETSFLKRKGFIPDKPARPGGLP